MRKSLIIIVFFAIVAFAVFIIAPNAKQITGHLAKMEYGFVSKSSDECNMVQAAENMNSLHYFIKRSGSKTKVEFFCFDEKAKKKR